MYRATFIPLLIPSSKLFIFAKFISSIVDNELSIIINPITVPTIPSFKSVSETKNPLSTISYSLNFNSWIVGEMIKKDKNQNSVQILNYE